MIDCPRILIAGAGSGDGKTTITCGLLGALTARGVRAAAFKCGPDYIDPMFHRQVLGAESQNLDLFLSDEAHVRASLARGAAARDIAVLEGVMGYYDGLGGASTRASTYDVARAADAPVVLVVDGRGASLSLAAIVKGFAALRSDSRIRGVIINRTSQSLCARLAPAIERETGIPVLGCLPKDARWALESRHLGLITAAEVDGLVDKMAALARAFAETVNVDALIQIARAAPPLADVPTAPPTAATVRLAVADDRAFCFRYAENLECLRGLGVKPAFFSPIADRALPDDVDGLYLCGGYPELYAAALSENAAMRAAIRRAVETGMPTWAECGGFMYLMDAFRSADGSAHPLCGALPGECYQTDRLNRFGYTHLTAERDTLLLKQNESMPVHSFHYSDCTDPGNACTAQKGDRSWREVHGSATLFAGYPHAYLPGSPHAARNLVDAIRAFKAGRRA